MNKTEYMKILSKKLRRLPKEDYARAIILKNISRRQDLRMNSRRYRISAPRRRRQEN